MKQRFKQWWNKFTKFQKYCIVITIWIINLTLYIMLPEGWYILEAFHLIISGICGGIGAAIYRGDM
jgi:hypothetical protein